MSNMSKGNDNTAKAADSAIFEWNPAELIKGRPQSADKAVSQLGSAGFALVVLNQPLHHLDVTRRLWDNAQVRVAADGGANALYEAAGEHGDSCFDDLAVIIGDLDSLTPAVRSYYESHKPTGPKTRVIRDPDQYSTDFGKAVAYIRQQHSHTTTATTTTATTTTASSEPQTHPNDDSSITNQPLDIVAIGGLGGRVDQGLSQLHHLYLFQRGADYADGRVYLFSGESLTFLLKPGRHRIRVRDANRDSGGAGDGDGDGVSGTGDVFGKHVGILPVGGPSRITTSGLEWDVSDWETWFGGPMSTSNHVLPTTEVVEVETTAEVLFTIALRQG
ncbi:thiamine pyrophosphokinase [Chaetomium fimeti]|uniref:Thiamine pyrophosphokinase n=1 Tax=Chaetomium fimeti TaxID=1854472 RepID=A0AAE0H5Z3_9PEZI|nr:thiamine pyrophosphokinase [Chaetomium fimeti]